VHEAIATAGLCARRGIGVAVVDMPSIDDVLLLQLYDSGKLLIFAEQNNGYIWQNFLKVLYRHRKASADLARVATINTLDSQGRARFIHSGTYEELVEAFGLTAAHIAESIEKRVNP
jgi:transketolase C-terminal domain/subunit